MINLKNVTALVKSILEADERARNNDSFLYLRVLEYYAVLNGLDLKNTSVQWFFENREGWGLGLYIVKTLVCSHGENISVVSKNGRTEFTFTLPLVI